MDSSTISRMGCRSWDCFPDGEGRKEEKGLGKDLRGGLLPRGQTHPRTPFQDEDGKKIGLWETGARTVVRRKPDEISEKGRRGIPA